MKREDIKLAARYVVLTFIMYLAYIVTDADYLLKVKDIDPMVLNVTVGAIFGALTLVIKSHFDNTIGRD